MSKDTDISVWLIVSLLTGLGIYNSFIQDDAFITFRYSQHLADGYGAVWNLHDNMKVAGYTDPLWMLLIAFADTFRIDPVISSKLFGLFFGLVTLIYTYRVALFVTRSKNISLTALILLGTNYTFSSYMTGGLETQMQTALITLSLYYTVLFTSVTVTAKKMIILSSLYALAILTRLDSALFIAVLYIYSVFIEYGKGRVSAVKSVFMPLTLPVAFATISILAINYFYYGDMLPNTFYIKAAGFSFETIERGFFYIKSFFNAYMLTPFILLLVWYHKKIFTQKVTILMLFIIVIWILYIIKVGGGFMEYRFMVPVMPMIYILTAISIGSVSYPLIRYLLTAILIASSIYHAKTFSQERGIESFDWLQGHLYVPSSDWVGIGKKLKSILNPNNNSNITIAVTAAGAIPYYSRLESVDMLGLNDRWIAIHGRHIDMKVGHDRYAPLEYLLKRGVNIVIGHPKMVPLSSKSVTDPRKYFWYGIDISKLPEDISILEIPINEKFKLDMLYLKRDPDIDRAVERGEIERINTTPQRLQYN